MIKIANIKEWYHLTSEEIDDAIRRGAEFEHNAQNFKALIHEWDDRKALDFFADSSIADVARKYACALELAERGFISKNDEGKWAVDKSVHGVK